MGTRKWEKEKKYLPITKKSLLFPDLEQIANEIVYLQQNPGLLSEQCSYRCYQVRAQDCFPSINFFFFVIKLSCMFWRAFMTVGRQKRITVFYLIFFLFHGIVVKFHTDKISLKGTKLKFIYKINSLQSNIKNVTLEQKCSKKYKDKFPNMITKFLSSILAHSRIITKSTRYLFFTKDCPFYLF